MAGVAVIGGIGGTESVWLGGGGVYQEWEGLKGYLSGVLTGLGG